MRATVAIITTGSKSANASIHRGIWLAKESRNYGIESVVMLLDAKDNRAYAEHCGITDRTCWVSSRSPLSYLEHRNLLQMSEVIHLINPTLAGICASLSSSKVRRLVLSDWDELYESVPGNFADKLRRIFLQQISAALSNCFVFSSKWLRGWYSRQRTRKPCYYIPYGLNGGQVNSLADDSLTNSGKRWIIYLGGLSRAYRKDLKEIVTLANVIVNNDMGIGIIGDGLERGWLEGELRKVLPPEQLRFFGAIPPETVDPILASPHVKACFLPLENTLQNRCRCPNKMFHYAKAAKTVLTNRVGEVIEILNDNAEYYEYENRLSLKKALDLALRKVPHYDYASMSWACRAKDYVKVLQKHCNRIESDNRRSEFDSFDDRLGA